MREPRLWIPGQAEQEIKRRRQRAMLHLLHEQEEMAKAFDVQAQRFPRKILPSLASLGVYQGIQDVHKATNLTFDILRRLANTPIIRMIIETRVRQVQRYARPPRFRGDTGFRVTLRDPNARPTAGDYRRMEHITQFLLDGGVRRRRSVDGAWGVWSGDEYDEALPLMDAVGVLVRDSLTMDAAALWLNPTAPNDRDKIPCVMFKPVDAALIRRCLLPLPRGVELAGEAQQYTPYQPEIRRDLRVPAFVMLTPDGKPLMEFGRDELAYLVRNPRSDWWSQGYGYAELESLLDVVVGLLTAVHYNVSYFTENHVPPAIMVGSGQFSEEWLQDFLSTMVSQVGGPNKWHKLPLLFGDENARLELIPLRSGQREDMLWREWLIFLINLACSEFHIAAEEVNFQAFLTRGGVLTQAAGAERVTTAQDTGLRPLVYHLFAYLDRWIVSRFWADPNTGVGPYTIVPEGVDQEDEQAALQADSAAISSGRRTVNEVRQERGEAPYRDPLDDDLWNDCENVIRRRWAEAERYPEAFREKVEQLYRAAGGKFARWPDAPANPTLLQIWMQEHQADIAAQQQEEYGPEVPGAGTPQPDREGEDEQEAQGLEMLGGPVEPQQDFDESDEDQNMPLSPGVVQRLFGGGARAAKALGRRVIEVFVRRG